MKIIDKLNINEKLYKIDSSENNVDKHINIPKNKPSKFFKDFPSLLIRFILLIVTKIL